jgi:threonine dehydrogenase-like Zn-dependent dehydrogenase
VRALTWQGAHKVPAETLPDPAIQEPTDAIVRTTSTAICGSDLHLYDVLGMYVTRATSAATSRWESSRRWAPRTSPRTQCPLEQAPHGYDIFEKKQGGCIKVVLSPSTGVDALTSARPTAATAQPIDHPDRGGRNPCSRPAEPA